jgi:serine/threonine protein kinase/DNA-binding winged helix-turn-helix (wHTH) protein
MTLRYQFADLEVDAARRAILAGRASISLQRRPMDVLLLLLKHHDRVVSREQLLECVWGGRVVTNAVVDQAVLKVRRALESLGASGVVQTAHGVGYRIAVPVAVIDQAQTETVAFRSLLAVPAAADRLDRLASGSATQIVNSGLVLFSFDRADDCLDSAWHWMEVTDHRYGAAIHVPVATCETGDARAIVAALAGAAPAGQVLLSASAFELCRHRPLHTTSGALRWIAYGPYRADGSDAVISTYGLAAGDHLDATALIEGRGLHRARSDDVILGWRAGEGQAIPGMTGWILDHQLAESGFGETWLGHHAETAERRAFKFCFRVQHLKALRREVSVIERLEQRLGARRDIARILDWNLQRPPYFIASEYTEHGDLEVWAEAQGGLQQVPLPTRLRLVAQVAEAAAAAHSAGVLHKDVKPANVLIRMDSDGPRAVLTDFGIGLLTAEQLLQSQDTTLITQGLTDTGSGSSGTTIYMAPELFEGRPPGPACDVYSIGVLLYQAVVGDLRRVLAPGWDRDIGDEVLREDIAEMVDGDLTRRISDAQVIGDRLRRLPERQQEHAMLRGMRERLERERRRRKVLVPTLAAVSLFAAVVTYQSVRLYQLAAEAEHQAAIAAERAATAEATRSFLISLFESTDPLAASTAGMSARELLDRGSERLTETLAGEPRVLADLLDALGAIYKNLGRHEDAQRHLERALALREGALPADPGRVAGTLFRLGDLAYQTGSFQAGEGYLRRAIELQETLGRAAEGDLAWSRYKLSHILRRQGRAAAAREQALLALEIAQRSGAATPARLGRMQSALASVLWLEGRLVEARDQFARAIETTAAATGAASPDSAAVLAKAAAVLGELEAWAEQERVARQALDIDLRLLGEEHLFVGEVKALIASALAGQGRYGEADALFTEAIAVLQRTVGEHPSLASALTAYARMRRLQGEFRAANELAARGLELHALKLGPEHQEVALSQLEQARGLLAEGRDDEASDILRHAEGVAARATAPGHWLPHAISAAQAYVELRAGRPDRSQARTAASTPALTASLGASHSQVLASRLVGTLAAIQLNPATQSDAELGRVMESLEQTPGSGYLLAFARQSVLAARIERSAQALEPTEQPNSGESRADLRF